MTPRRPAALAITVILALTAQVTYATPARAVRELRAVTCCAAHCGHARSATRTARCCQLSQDAGTTAVVAPAPFVAAAPSLALRVAVATVPAPCSTAHLIDGHDRSLGRAGPVFLFTRSLLL